MTESEIDAGDHPGTTTDECHRIAELEEVNDLRRANEILRRWRLLQRLCFGTSCLGTVDTRLVNELGCPFRATLGTVLSGLSVAFKFTRQLTVSQCPQCGG